MRMLRKLNSEILVLQNKDTRICTSIDVQNQEEEQNADR